MRRTILALVILLVLAAPAQAVTLRDLIDLSKAGLSDDLLIALVEAEKSVFTLNAADLQELKRQGLSDRLLIHLLQTPSLREEAARATQAFAAVTAAPREPEVVVIDRVETVAVPVAVPVYVPVDVEQPRPRPAAPVYWGYGGKLRPDAWKPAGEKRRQTPRR